MPLRSPVPPGAEVSFNYGGVSFTWPQMVAEVERLIAADDAAAVNRYAIDMTSVLGLSFESGALSEFDPLAQELEQFLATVSRWLRDRAAAGEGGRGVVFSETEAGDISYEAATAEGAATRPTFTPEDAIRGIVAYLNPSDVQPGEDLASAIRRAYLAEYGEEPPAGSLNEYVGIIPFVEPTPPSTNLVPNGENGGPSPTMPPQGGGPTPTSETPEKPGPLPPSAPGASKLLYAGAIALGLLALLGGRKRS